MLGRALCGFFFQNKSRIYIFWRYKFLICYSWTCSLFFFFLSEGLKSCRPAKLAWNWTRLEKRPVPTQRRYDKDSVFCWHGLESLVSEYQQPPLPLIQALRSAIWGPVPGQRAHKCYWHLSFTADLPSGPGTHNSAWFRTAGGRRGGEGNIFPRRFF